MSDAHRDRAFAAAGWTVLIFTQADYADGFVLAVKRIKAALQQAWTDPAIVAGFASSR